MCALMHLISFTLKTKKSKNSTENLNLNTHKKTEDEKWF